MRQRRDPTTIALSALVVLTLACVVWILRTDKQEPAAPLIPRAWHDPVTATTIPTCADGVRLNWTTDRGWWCEGWTSEEARKVVVEGHAKPRAPVELPPRGEWQSAREHSPGLIGELLKPGGSLHQGEEKAAPTAALTRDLAPAVSTASGGVGRTDAPPSLNISTPGAFHIGTFNGPEKPGGVEVRVLTPETAANYEQARQAWAEGCERDGGRVLDVLGGWLCRPDCAGQAQGNFGPCPGWQRPDAIQYTQASGGDGSTADAPASAAAAPGPGPGPGGSCK